MKCLTVCQPHAWAIVHSSKGIENRPWRTNYRGPLVIHAGLSRKWLGDTLWYECHGISVPDNLAFGAALGVVDLVDCLPAEELRDEPFACGPWCWVLDNPQPFDEPIPMRGSLGLFEVDGRSLLLDIVAAECAVDEVYERGVCGGAL